MTRKFKTFLSAGLVGAALLALSTELAAQSLPDPSGCSGLASSVCVSQVGSGNAFTVDQAQSKNSAVALHLEGDRNGHGALGGVVSKGLTPLGALSGGPTTAPVIMPLLQSGFVAQAGHHNDATVMVLGNDNDYHIAQQGDRNSALQLVRGEGNAAAAVQGDGPFDTNNVSEQLQIGADNISYVKQSGSNNVSIQQQVPTAEAALLGLVSSDDAATLIGMLASGAFGSADNNSILLEQEGGDNEANLTQIGSNHSIALRQQGGAQITITQLGFGKSIAVDQPAGSQGVQILQY